MGDFVSKMCPFLEPSNLDRDYVKFMNETRYGDKNKQPEYPIVAIDEEEEAEEAKPVSSKAEKNSKVKRTVSVHEDKFQQISEDYGLTMKQVNNLFQVFYGMLPEGHDGKLRYADLARVCDDTNPLRERILLAFFANPGRGLDRRVAMDLATLDFEGYCQQMAIFLPDHPPRAKLEFLFRIYDERHVGKLTMDDLDHFLHDMLGSSFNKLQRQQIAHRMIYEFGGSEDMAITFPEFEIAARGCEKGLHVLI